MIYLVYIRDSHLFRSILHVSYVLFTRSEMRNVKNVRSTPRRFDISIFERWNIVCHAHMLHARGNARRIRSSTKIKIYMTAMGYITALYVYAVDPARSRVYRQRLYRELRMVEL